MSGIVSWKNICGIFLFSRIIPAFIAGNVAIVEQTYTCQDSVVKTVAINATLKHCEGFSRVSINETVYCSLRDCFGPIKNVTYGQSLVVEGCHHITYICYSGDIEERHILTPIPTERNDTGLSTGVIVAIIVAISTLVIFVIILWRNFHRITDFCRKKFHPVSSPQTRTLRKRKIPTEKIPWMALAMIIPDRQKMKFVSSGDGEIQETLENSDEDIILIE
ncbi:uncharacterized protein LOC129706155 [Leucoraja erinacea]|uniref:uncharacterized protein LOC129706155 n=1 Tax=Leucoraja erinaceus TaxID=7782 RepID=UPI002455FF89|nr:uncharacterized protein LOC129706155 [Leucoraja erinacea]